MTQPSSQQRVSRGVERFVDHSRLGAEIGLSHQIIEDDRFTGDTIILHGRKVANFGLCSYLALGDDPRVVTAAENALRRYGSAYSSSLAYTALPLYADLTDRLQAMVGVPLVIAGTTTLAHMAALPLLVRSGDIVAVDAQAHASVQFVIPSLRALGAEVHKVVHNDLERVADITESTGRRVWYLIDGLYSMHGDTAPAEDIVSLLNANENLWVYCDDAHGFGWAGATGEGQFLARAGWHDRLVMSFGLSKSFGALGGVVAARDEELVELVRMGGGPLVFGGPIPPASLGAGIASADIHLSPELATLQADLMERIDLVNRHATAIGLPIAGDERTPLWFVEVGQSLTSGTIVARMLKDGFYVNVAVYPVVRAGHAGVRFTVTRYNTLAQIESMLESLHGAWLRHKDDEDVIDLTVLED
jgi:7-keto-8-aminopelargonate synthetase-like enzyme